MSNKHHILIVDDNHINRQFFSMSLKKANIQTTAAEDGYEAIEFAKNNAFDLILMDIRMPGIDGYETTKQIRLLSNHQKTPIFATSAENIVKDKQQCFNDFLLKPISPKLLIKKIRDYCPVEAEQAVVFNQNDALKYAYHDKDIMLKLIDMFVTDLPMQMSVLDKHMTLLNKQACIDTIHKIRGSCKACGAQELDSQLEQLSLCFRNGNRSKSNSKSEHYHRVKQAVQNYLLIDIINQ
ncbi:MAG: response regulator [Proteobacteria bacterium]|nr:response regulator [Pseudomonadota bacterium]